MKQQNLVLKAALVAALGVMAGQAGAAVSLPSPTAVKFASELPVSTSAPLALTNAGSALDVSMPGVGSLDPTTSTPLYLKLALSSGAKFTANPSVSCSGVTAGGGDATAFTGAVTFGGAGQSNVTFTISTASQGGTAAAIMSGGTAACVVTINGITLSAATTTDVNMSATYEYTNGAAATVSGFSGAYIDFTRGFTANMVEAAGNLVVDAINGATRFTAGGAAFTSASAVLGSVKTTAVASVFGADGATVLTAADVFTAVTLTVSGPAIAAALVNGSSGVYLSSASSCGNITVVATDSGSSSVTFAVSAANASALQTSMSGASGLFICANLSGNNSQITTGQITAALSSASGVANVTADLSAASNNIENLTQNGASMNAYFINASTSTNKTSVLRVINTGSTSATFRGTAYAEDGTVLGTASATLGTASGNGMLSLTSAELESKLGFTPSSGTVKYRVLITGNLSAFKVINFTRDVATGNLALSQQQDN